MKRWHVLAVLGLAAVSSLALIPIETLLTSEMPAWQLRLALIAQPALLICLSIVAGEKCSGRAGLSAPVIDAFVAGRVFTSVLRRQLGPSLVVGGSAAILLVGYAVWVGPHVAPTGQLAEFASFQMPLATKVLYGGVGEEIITRWGLLSLIAVLGLVVLRPTGSGRNWVMLGAITLAALAFAAAHLPLLFLINEAPQHWVIGAVLAGNALPGFAFGWLFWKRGLEAAMLAHIVAHLASTGALAVLGL